MLRFLIAQTGNPGEAEDLLQELWFRVERSTPGPVAHGRAYLYRAAQNLVLDKAREVSRRARRDTDWADTQGRVIGNERAYGGIDADEALIEREETEALARAIEGLPDRAKQAFYLHKLEGRSHSETAAVMGISRSGVEKHIAVAMTFLRNALSS